MFNLDLILSKNRFSLIIVFFLISYVKVLINITVYYDFFLTAG